MPLSAVASVTQVRVVRRLLVLIAARQSTLSKNTTALLCYCVQCANNWSTEGGHLVEVTVAQMVEQVGGLNPQPAVVYLGGGADRQPLLSVCPLQGTCRVQTGVSELWVQCLEKHVIDPTHYPTQNNNMYLFFMVYVSKSMSKISFSAQLVRYFKL